MEQLAEEFARTGADITQTFTFYNREVGTPKGCHLTVSFTLILLFMVFLFISVSGDKPGFL